VVLHMPCGNINSHIAVVKEIREKETNRDLVLRVINKAKVFGQEDLITNELKIMKTLRHENILQVVDDWETSDEICLVLEQIEVDIIL